MAGLAINRARTCAIVLLVLQPLLFYRTALINPTCHIPYDLVGFHAPLANYISWSLREGRLPMWDPNPYCGYPIHADVQAQLFYPPAWLVYAARNLTRPGTTVYWLEWLETLHLMAAGLLTFWLLRRQKCSIPAAYLGGVIFQLGAFFASQAEHLGAISGATWMPLAWLAVLELRERFQLRWFALLAIALALTFLAGFTAITLVAFFSTALVLLASRPRPIALLWLALAVAAVVPLVAVQLFPTMELTQWSVAGLRASWNRGAGTPPKAWLSFLWANYHQVFHPFDPKLFHGDYEFTLLYCYSGIAAVVGCVAALFRRDARIWVILAAVFAILQCGNRVPGFETVFNWMPPFVRGPMYADFFLAAACLAIAVASAMAFSRLPERVVWIVALATAVELILVASNRPMNAEAGSWKTLTSESTINGDSQLSRILQEITHRTVPPGRLDALDLNATLSMGASLLQLPTPDGDNPFAPRRIIELRRLFAKGEWWERQLAVNKPGSPLLDFLNVRLLVAETAQENPGELAKLSWLATPVGKSWRLYESGRAQPRFFFVDRVREAATPQQALELVQSMDLRHEAVIEGSAGLVARAGEARVVRYDPDAIVIEANSEDAGFLVSSETYYPGWDAEIDGKEEPILLTNYAFRGLHVPAGKHRVEIRYKPRGLAALALLSGLSWLVFGLLALGVHRKFAYTFSGTT